MKLNFILLLLAISVSACRKNPIERLTDPNADGAVPQSSGIFFIYDNELKTGGGVVLFPLGSNQSIDLANYDSPINSGAHMRYEWNGQPVGSTQTFAGFSLNSPSSKNLSAPGYSTLRMKLRGSLSSGNTLRIEGPSDGITTPARVEIPISSLSNVWQDVSLVVPGGHFGNVSTFATFSIQYAQPPRTTAPGNGGIIYIDDLRYER